MHERRKGKKHAAVGNRAGWPGWVEDEVPRKQRPASHPGHAASCTHSRYRVLTHKDCRGEEQSHHILDVANVGRVLACARHIALAVVH